MKIVMVFSLMAMIIASHFPTGVEATSFSQLTNLPYRETYPAWCGDFVFFDYDSPAPTVIYRIPSSGGTPIYITDPAEISMHPDLSGTCNWLVFTSGGRTIWKQVALPDSSRIQLTSHPTEEFPAWSPDGSKIYYIRALASWIMDADGSNQREIESAGVENGRGDWSPDGNKIVFGTKRTTGGNFEIWTMNADGSNPMVLFADPAKDLS